MRVLVAPDKFAGTLTAVEAAEAIAGGLARGARPTTSSTWRRWPTAARASSTCCTRRSGGELLAVTVRGPHGEPAPATRAVAGDTAYVESAQACGLHLTGAGGRRERPRRTASASWSPPRSTPGRHAVVVGLGGSGTNDGGRRAARGARCHRRRAPRRRRRRPRRASPGGRRGRPGPGRRVRAGRGQRRRQPADRAVRRHQGVRSRRRASPRSGCRPSTAGSSSSPRRPTAGSRWRRAPAPRAASASRCCCSAPPASRASPWSPTAVGLAERARAADLVITGEGAFDYSSRGRQGAVRRRRRSPRRRCGRAWCWRARCWSARGRCGRWASSRRTRWSTWWGRSGRSPSPPAALADLAERTARTWSR